MIGRETNETSVLNQHKKIFEGMDTFYFLEPTQKESEYELYFTHQNEDNPEKNFVNLVGTIYQYETARIIMNTLNDRLKKINDRA